MNYSEWKTSYLNTEQVFFAKVIRLQTTSMQRSMTTNIMVVPGEHTTILTAPGECKIITMLPQGGATRKWVGGNVKATHASVEKDIPRRVGGIVIAKVWMCLESTLQLGQHLESAK